jgi:hypothetical protein
MTTLHIKSKVGYDRNFFTWTVGDEKRVGMEVDLPFERYALHPTFIIQDAVRLGKENFARSCNKQTGEEVPCPPNMNRF